MLRYCTLALCLFMGLSAAQAQSFNRKRNKRHHAYISEAITTPVNQPERPGEDGAQTGGRDLSKTSGAHEARTSREIRKENRRQQKAAKRAARIARNEENRKYREERNALGKQLAERGARKRGVGR